MKRLLFIITILFMITQLSFANNLENIVDPNLNKYIQSQLGLKSSITISQLQKFEFLCVDSCNISSLRGLELASNLLALRLYNCTIDDISDISNLSNLKELSIRNCNIKDIAPLSNLTNLNYLVITNDKVKDISVLSNLKDLKWLDLNGNQIVDLSALANLNRLQYLNIKDNPISVENLNNSQKIIKNNNPSILINQDDTPQDPNLFKLLNAKAIFSNFIYSEDFYRNPALIGPQLPDIKLDIKTSMDYIEKYDDLEYLADISYMLVKYAIEIDSNYRPSFLMQRDNPLIKTFFSKLKLDSYIFGDEIVLSVMAGWICDNRDKFGPSALLDAEIEKYQSLKEELKNKY